MTNEVLLIRKHFSVCKPQTSFMLYLFKLTKTRISQK